MLVRKIRHNQPFTVCHHKMYLEHTNKTITLKMVNLSEHSEGDKETWCVAIYHLSKSLGFSPATLLNRMERRLNGATMAELEQYRLLSIVTKPTSEKDTTNNKMVVIPLTDLIPDTFDGLPRKYRQHPRYKRDPAYRQAQDEEYQGFVARLQSEFHIEEQVAEKVHPKPKPKPAPEPPVSAGKEAEPPKQIALDVVAVPPPHEVWWKGIIRYLYNRYCD